MKRTKKTVTVAATIAHNVKASGATIAALKAYATARNAHERAGVKLGDRLLADGFTRMHFVSPKSPGSKASPELWVQVREMALAMLPADAVKLVGMKPAERMAVRAGKAIERTAKDANGKPQPAKYWQQQIGARITDMKNAVHRAEIANNGGVDPYATPKGNAKGARPGANEPAAKVSDAANKAGPAVKGPQGQAIDKWARETLSRMVKEIQKAEALACDIPDLVQHLNAALAILRGTPAK